MIYLQKKICLSCRKYRLLDVDSGLCRLDKSVEYPTKTNEESCEKWVDGGHQYDIRCGWIRKTLENAEKVDSLG